MHQQGVETEEVHACTGISPSLLFTAAAHLAIKNVLCALFGPQRAEPPQRLYLRQSCQLRSYSTKTIHTRHSHVCPETLLVTSAAYLFNNVWKSDLIEQLL